MEYFLGKILVGLVPSRREELSSPTCNSFDHLIHNWLYILSIQLSIVERNSKILNWKVAKITTEEFSKCVSFLF